MPDKNIHTLSQNKAIAKDYLPGSVFIVKSKHSGLLTACYLDSSKTLVKAVSDRNEKEFTEIIKTRGVSTLNSIWLLDMIAKEKYFLNYKVLEEAKSLKKSELSAEFCKIHADSFVLCHSDNNPEDNKPNPYTLVYINKSGSITDICEGMEKEFTKEVNSSSFKRFGSLMLDSELMKRMQEEKKVVVQAANGNPVITTTLKNARDLRNKTPVQKTIQPEPSSSWGGWLASSLKYIWQNFPLNKPTVEK
jgi:hypothetical protein